MISIEEMQFGGLLTLTMLTLILALGVPARSALRAEYAGAMLFVFMQGYYFRIHFTEYRRLKRVVDHIADHCGFNSREYFHQVFQEHTDTTLVKFLARVKLQPNKY